MSTLMMTEAEQEQIVRAQIDRLDAMHGDYAEREGIAPAGVQLEPADFERAEREAAAEAKSGPAPAGISRSRKILDACKRLADPSGKVNRKRLYEAVGATTLDAKKRICGLIYALQRQGRFSYTMDDVRRRRAKPKAIPDPDRAALSALKRATNGDPAALAELAARIDRLWDGMTESDRAFAAGYIRLRFG